MANNTLARDTSNKVIAGVCSGIARRLGVSATLVRVVFLVSCALPGPQVFLY
nr:PspC domain-containing protein [Geodermatophilaceae bacterium]